MDRLGILSFPVFSRLANSLLSIAALTLFPSVNCSPIKSKLLLHSLTPVFTIEVLVFNFSFWLYPRGNHNLLLTCYLGKRDD